MGGFTDPLLSEVWHSGKWRAEQTAEILAQALASNVMPAPHRGMKPKDDPTIIFDEISAARDRRDAFLLAGHLPHLTCLAGLLLTGDAEQSPVRLVNAAVLRLGFRDGAWAVDWYLTPACVT